MKALRSIPRRHRVLLALVMLGIALILGTAALLISGTPMLFRWTEGEEECTNLDFRVLNPYRDRRPEAAADSFFELLKVGRCEDAVSGLEDPDNRYPHICDFESAHKLLRWDLRNRKDGPGGVDLYYWIWNQGVGEHEMAWVTVKKTDRGFRVAVYSCIL